MKGTNRLQRELMETPDLDRFLSENRDSFHSGSIHELLNTLFQKRNISKAALAKQSCISEVYLHQVFAGRRSPSRSRLICLCFGLSATLEETQELLKQCALAQLYPKNKRDAILIYGLVNHVSLSDVNDKLFSEGEETLF